MSQMHKTADLQFDLRDRLHKSMRVSSHGTTSLGLALGVHRNTISNYLSGRITPDRRTLMAWASATGVPVEWLETGSVTGPGGSTPTLLNTLPIAA